MTPYRLLIDDIENANTLDKEFVISLIKKHFEGKRTKCSSKELRSTAILKRIKQLHSEGVPRNKMGTLLKEETTVSRQHVYKLIVQFFKTLSELT